MQKTERKPCDKCDSKTHTTEACPHFKKGRDDHKDAFVNYGKKHPLDMGTSGGNFSVHQSKATRMPQPGDGSCLFHSLRYGLQKILRGNIPGAHELRRQLANFIARNSRLEIAGDTLEEWVCWDQNTTCENYARRMAQSGWGGGIEIAACTHVMKVNVHVYEQHGGNYKRISCFDHPSAPQNRTVNVIYRGRMHYDALVMTN